MRACSALWSGLVFATACSSLYAAETWHDPSAPLRRVVYIDGADIRQPLTDLPVELRFPESELAAASGSMKVFSGSEANPLRSVVESSDAKLGVVLRVWIPRLAPGDKQTIHVYYGGNASSSETSAGVVENDSKEIAITADAASPTGVRVLPKNVQIVPGYRAMLEPGYMRPAIRGGDNGILRIELPSELAATEEGWTIECLAYDDDPNVQGLFYGRSLVSAWPENVGIVAETPGEVSIAASGYKYDPLAWCPVENRLPLINFGLINNRPYSCTHKSGGTWDNWQMPLFGRYAEPRAWHVYSATYKPSKPSGECRLYLDGDLQKTDHAAAGLKIGSLCIGSWNRPRWIWRGLIDSVRVTRTPLSDDAILVRAMSCLRNPRFLVVSVAERRDSTDIAASTPLVKIAPTGRIRRYEQPVFRWSFVPGAKEYQLAVWDADSRQRPILQAATADTRYQPDFAFENGKTYLWRVRPVSADAPKPSDPLAADNACAPFQIAAIPAADVAALDPPRDLRPRLAMRPVDSVHIEGSNGPVAERLQAAKGNWVLRYPESNPDIIGALVEQQRSLEHHPWWGESYGKFMTGAALFYDLTRDAQVKTMLDAQIAKGIAAQQPDGYLGSYPKEVRLTGPGIMKENWDLYIIHHELTAFLEYYRLTGNEAVLRSAMRLADLVCDEFGPGRANIIDLSYDTSSNNYCLLGPIVALYRITGRPRYLAMAEKIVDEWEKVPGGMEYIALAEQKKHLTELHWGHGFEMMLSFAAMVDLYATTGDKRLLDTVVHWWNDAVNREVQINGNLCPFASEFYTGDPYYTDAAMETCAATAFMRFSTKVLWATADPRCVDAIEKSLYNAHFAAQRADGSDYAITVPLSGVNKDLRPPMTCCPAWGLVGMTSLRNWAALTTSEEPSALVVNYFGDYTTTSRIGAGEVTLQASGRYPAEPESQLTVRCQQEQSFALWLRIPGWSTNTQVWLNDRQLPVPEPGNYLKLNRTWTPGDRVRMVFDFQPRWLYGENRAKGLAAVYRGPLLLSVSQQHNPGLDLKKLPRLSPKAAFTDGDRKAIVRPQPWALVETRAADGTKIIFSDYANAGGNGSEFVSWVPVEDPAVHSPGTD